MSSYSPVRSERRQSSFFLGLLILSQILGVACIILTCVWLGVYYKGFSWTNSQTIFNYHPLFMVLGMLFLYGDAILVYRVFNNYRKLPIKVLHAVLHILAFLFSVIGIRAVFEMHDIFNYAHLYSLHSWLGIGTVALFAIQWIGGLISFLLPQIPQRVRAKVLPIHVASGSFLFLMVVAVCVSGITEKNFFEKQYSLFLPREMIGNALGVCIVLFGYLVYFLITHPNYRRVEEVSPEHRALNE